MTTIHRWHAEAMMHPERATMGSLLKPEPPVRRFADVVRHLVQEMTATGFGGSEMIAQVLARAGWKMSRRSVQRIRREQRLPRPRDPEPGAGERRAVRARHPGHVLLMDITDIPTLFRILTLKLMVVFDGFSRMPLAARLLPSEPTAEQAAALFATAAGWHGPAVHLVTDQGSQFTAEAFRRAVQDREGTKQRFGAVGKYGSIALVERFWRTLKGLAQLRREPPLTPADAADRVRLALLHYSWCRPHRALGGATPAEVHFGIRPAHLDPIPPPRGRPGDIADATPVEIAFLDPELPLLIPRAA